MHRLEQDVKRIHQGHDGVDVVLRCIDCGTMVVATITPLEYADDLIHSLQRDHDELNDGGHTAKLLTATAVPKTCICSWRQNNDGEGVWFMTEHNRDCKTHAYLGKGR